MDKKKQEALKKKGWKFGDAADFLGMSPAERRLLDEKVKRSKKRRKGAK